MKQEVLRAWDMPWLPIVALILFVVFFGAYVFWAYRKKNQTLFQKISMIPLEDAPQIKKGSHNEAR